MTDAPTYADDYAPCPNCRKEGDPFADTEYKHYCPDEACPVLTYDWNGKYVDSEGVEA